uniref:Uncharacterized protein n=1 Tax=viral metagenome TaxID=1070528 RepID=A0A6M3KZV6_9ZZZZ
MDTKAGTVPMQCTHCRRTAEFSPLRLGKICGNCHTGKWIPKKPKETVDERPDRQRVDEGVRTEQAESQ